MSKLINHGQRLGGRDAHRRSKHGSITALALFTIYYSLFALPAVADEYHYNNILIGDRAAGMGGAYTAISDDPSGLFYNPAGIAYTQGSNVSVSANAFHQTQTTYKNVLGGNSWERTSSALLPNFFGIIQPLGKGKVGFSYAVPDSIVEDQDQVFTNITGVERYIINFNNNDNTYYFGPSYAVELSKGLSVGATLYAQYRSNQWIMNNLIRYVGSPGQYRWTNVYYQTSDWGVRPVVGLMWNTTEKLSIGLTASQTKILYSTTTKQVTTKLGSYDGSTLDYNAASFGEKRSLPFTTALGFAYFPSNKLIISGDFSYYTKTKGLASNPGDDRIATWNAALGTEYYLTDQWALRGGLFTDRANTPQINSNSVDALDHVDLYGGSLSASYFTRQSSITFGSTYRYGAGKAQLLGDAQIQDVQMQAWTHALSAAYFY